MSRTEPRDAAVETAAVGKNASTWWEELRRPYLWLVTAVCVVVFCPSLDATRLWDDDEGFFASAAAEMYARGDWIVPYFNGEMFAHKPPWMYWMMMLGFKLFGVGELGARCFSAVFGIASVLLTYRLGGVLMNQRVGFFAAIILATSLMFTVVGRAATPDVYLVLFSTWALYIFAAHGFAHRPRGEVAGPDGESARLPARWASFAWMYALMGLGTLTKGPIGFLFPMAVIGLFLLSTTPRRPIAAAAPAWRRWFEALLPFGPANFLRTVWLMRPLTASLMILAVAGPWYYAVGVQTDGEFLREFFGVHHFHRAATSMESHGGSFFYYPLSILIGMFPWSVFAAPTLLLWMRRMRQPEGQHPAALFITCWICVYVVIFSLAATKLPNYILPAYPALALCFAYALDAWLASSSSLGAGWHRAAFGTLALVGVGMIVAFPLFGLIEFGGQTVLDRAGLTRAVQHEAVWLGLLGLPAAVGGLAALVLAERRRLGAAIGAVCFAAVLTVVALWNEAAPWVDQFQASQDIVQRIHRDHGGAGDEIGTYGFFRPSMVFYNGGPVHNCREPNAVRRFFALHPEGFLITESSKLDELEPFLPLDRIVVAQRPRFPEKGELTLLARRPGGMVAEKPDRTRRQAGVK
ncbi:MAG TPA: glycosyltransferase family 39 protein [Pirellulaceae bacterium]|nr:glycosyltransferase family 39 protein [Pirellulaceae bacterium]